MYCVDCSISSNELIKAKKSRTNRYGREIPGGVYYCPICDESCSALRFLLIDLLQDIKEKEKFVEAVKDKISRGKKNET